MGGVLVGIVAEKYEYVHDFRPVPCDLGYIVGKAMSFKRNGEESRQQSCQLEVGGAAPFDRLRAGSLRALRLEAEGISQR